MAGRIAYYGGIVTDGLVLHLDAAKKDSYSGQGTVWNDISGRRNNGTLVNGPTFDSSNGGSIVFDGGNDYATVSPINFFNSSTLEFFLLSRNNDYKTIIRGVSAGIALTPRVSIRSNVINLFYSGGGGSGDIIFSFSSIPTNSYFHLAVTYDPVNNHRCYINGVLGSRSSNGTAINAVPAYTSFQIGIGAGSDGYFSGRMSYIRSYNRALSQQEILQNYNATKKRFGL